ncbi:ATP-binding protein [Algoriphagus sp. H41]|uniref:ATP-binding protein n=1 Tax=Algoriphagus oliviformis TaxID=2811231 RepID=A0ABS3BZ21_9BACT|nr:ATP-binding protein [Algoriphagus oliviformis]MBN7809651.1 ATP-binding protein [Algoriphagus oliviformis]
MKTYPFKFLDSYERKDRKVFFGRDEEIRSLYEMVFQSSVVLVYGASGTGKTSLINCGLAGEFQPHDWLALMVRRGSDINRSLEAALEQAGGKVDPDAVESKWLDEWEEEPSAPSVALTSIAKSIKAVYRKSFRPVYLIFDQFEELFILGTAAEQQEFIETLKGILQSGLPVKVLLSIREEYLGHLFEFERAIPQLLRKKLRVEPMNLAKVKDVVTGVAAHEDSNVSIKAGEEDAVAEAIFQKIKGDKKSLTIQLPFLQVFLDKLYLNITGDRSREAAAEFSLEKVREMGQIGDILSNFLEEQVAEISSGLKQQHPQLHPELTWKILSPFATLEGTKDPITKKELLDRLPNLDPSMVEDVVDAFSNSRLLRFNENTGTYEISHDSLAKPIAEKRSVEETALLEVKRLIKSQIGVKKEAREYFSEKQLVYIEPYLDKFKQTEEERDWIERSREFLRAEKQREAKQKYDDLVKSKKSMFLKIAVGVFVVLAGLFIFIAFRAQRNALAAQQAAISAESANATSTELLNEVLGSSGEKYENLTNEEIQAIIHREKTYPLDSLIEVRASVSPSNAGGNNRNYTMWLDFPLLRKDEIKEVHYNFCEGFIDQKRISNDPSSSFSIGYLGYGYCPEMKIDIVRFQGDTIHRYFSFEDYFRENPPTD